MKFAGGRAFLDDYHTISKLAFVDDIANKRGKMHIFFFFDKNLAW